MRLLFRNGVQLHLGINRNTLRKNLVEHGIDPEILD